MCPLYFPFKIWCCHERIGTLTNEIAGDGLILFSMVARLRYGGEHIELDLACDGKPGFHELGRRCRVPDEREKGAGCDPEG